MKISVPLLHTLFFSVTSVSSCSNNLRNLQRLESLVAQKGKLCEGRILFYKNPAAPVAAESRKSWQANELKCAGPAECELVFVFEKKLCEKKEYR